jgi:hypothetical protein
MPLLSRLLLPALAFLGACAPTATIDPGVPAPAPPARGGVALAVPPAGPLPVGASFRDAVAAGTRTLAGVPGARYWQQRVDYSLQVTLDPQTARLTGQGTIRYHNRSPDTLHVAVLRLHQNLFRAGEARTRRVPITGGVDVTRLVVGGVEAQPLVGGRPAPLRYSVDGTLLSARLPRPLAPGATLELEVGWTFLVPPAGAPRTGHIDHHLFNIAQWYPQLAVYDDLAGWDTWPYLGGAEFYLEYGDFYVAIAVPAGWLVAATGVLQNAQEVLSETVRERLGRAAAGDAIVRVVTEEDLRARAVTRTGAASLTWRFRARDVRDFAFALSDRYLWDATSVEVPAQTDGRRDRVPVHAFYRATARQWREAAAFARHALGFHAERWGPYVYPHISVAEGPIGGMEYPMLMFVGAFANPVQLYETINHEIAHQWWPMMVGNNEHADAWLDEGLVTYVENLATVDRFPGYVPFSNDLAYYHAVAGTDAETPIMRHGDLHGSYGAFVSAAYAKPSLLLRALGDIIGQDTLHEALRVYTRRWLMRHPAPHDFFATVEAVAGRDLSWFWVPWWFGTGTLRHAIAEVRPLPTGGAVVVIEDQGENPMPVTLLAETADGGRHTVRVPVEPWLAGERRQQLTIVAAAPVVRVLLDPDGRLPYADYAGLVWEGAAVPAGMH